MKIEFIIDDPKALEMWPVKPAKDYLPDWYSNLPPAKDNYTFEENVHTSIRSCLPVGDFLTSGYILFNVWETRIFEEIVNFKPTMRILTAKSGPSEKKQFKDNENSDRKQGLYSNNNLDIYSEDECPIHKGKKKNKNYFKMTTEWSIKTPNGYSCLVMQPFYLFEERYTILPAIIDTDQYPKKIPVVGYLNNCNELRLPAGVPLLQVIPFKRDTWVSQQKCDNILDKSKFFLYNAYKKLFHSEKIFK